MSASKNSTVCSENESRLITTTKNIAQKPVLSKPVATTNTKNGISSYNQQTAISKAVQKRNGRLIPIHTQVMQFPIAHSLENSKISNQSQSEMVDSTLFPNVQSLVQLVKQNHNVKNAIPIQSIRLNSLNSVADSSYYSPIQPYQSMILPTITPLDDNQMTELQSYTLEVKKKLPAPHGWILVVKFSVLQKISLAYERFVQVTKQLQIDIAVTWMIESIIKFISEYGISYVELSCERIIEIAQRPCILPFKSSDMIDCIQNIDDTMVFIQQPKQRFRTKNGQEIAAVSIQNAYRRYKKRQAMLIGIVKIKAMQIILRVWLRLSKRMSIQKRLCKQYQNVSLKGFKRLWSTLKRDRIQIFTFERTIVYLCTWSSAATDPDSRISDVDIGRALAMYDNNVDMILVLPHLNHDRLQYFKSIFDTSAFPKSPIESGRLRFVVPEVARFLPKSSSMAAALFFSCNAIAQIKTMCAGRTALLCSDEVNEYVVRCCTALNMPYFGTSIESFRDLTSKRSRERKFLRDSCIPCIKEFESTGESETEILNTIAKATMRHKDVLTWSLWPLRNIHHKHEQCESSSVMATSIEMYKNSRSISSFSNPNVATDIYSTSPSLYRCLILSRRFQKNSSPHDDGLSMEEAHAKLHIKPAMSASPDIPDISVSQLISEWTQYGGGVIRQYPNLNGAYRIVEVGIYIEWSLQWRLIVTCETRVAAGITHGMLVPQQSCGTETLIRYLYKIAKVCAAHEIFGAVSIEFWAWTNQETKKTEFVASRLKPYFTPQLQRASTILLSTGCKIDTTGYGMSYSRTGLPLKLGHLDAAKYCNKKKVIANFNDTIPTRPHRIALYFENLWHDIVSILTRRGALAKISLNGIGFDQWRCNGFLFPKTDQNGPKSLPMMCIASSLEEVLQQFLGGIVLIERYLQANDAKYESNFEIHVRVILDELLELKRHHDMVENSDNILGFKESCTSFHSTCIRPDIYAQPIPKSLKKPKIQDILRAHIVLPYGEVFDAQSSSVDESIEPMVNDEMEDEPSEPTMSSGTMLLLLEGIPSEHAAEADPTFYKPVVTPPGQKRGRRASSIHCGSKSFASMAVLAEQLENQKRVAALVGQLEQMMDQDEDSTHTDISKLQWSKLTHGSSTLEASRSQGQEGKGRRPSILVAIQQTSAFNFSGNPNNIIRMNDELSSFKKT
ncbi:hypothetical protein BDEG_20409 [Batrachochytrium dendrobatidis JEL423]|uniref:IQCH-like ATP-grasp domain-containing protein n=1 Tax=Batrachochytrium dendrobatidis (strain JEL423) TaxID=403673 RepID=A0A177W936_BATDL|nr:hypothetical protein BDEG_20409 [Batrachochytrium dendrobatidis JEL423]